MKMEDILVLGAVGVGGYFLYSWLTTPAAAAATTPATGTATTPSTPVTSVPVQTVNPGGVATGVTTPAAPAAPATVPAASVSLVGSVTPNVHNSLTANVSINGSVQNITIIQSNAQAYNTAGVNITSQLTAQGVSVPSLLAMMQAAYKPAAAASSAGVPASSSTPSAALVGQAVALCNLTTAQAQAMTTTQLQSCVAQATAAAAGFAGFGQLRPLRPPSVINPGRLVPPSRYRLPAAPLNYVRPGSPMRRIG